MQLIFYLITLGCMAFVKGEARHQWVEPDAFSLAEMQNEWGVEETGICPRCNCDSPKPVKYIEDESMEEKITKVYYKKLITFLFDRRKIEIDDITGVHIRSISFLLSADQLKLLEESADPRDWDAVIQDILPNVIERPIKETNNFPDSFSYVKSVFRQFSLSSEVRFGLLGLVALLSVRFLHIKYKYGVIAMLISGSFIFGFVHTYLDCNRKLEIEEMGDVLEDDYNPCAESSWFGAGILNFFSRQSSKAACMEYLKKKNRIRFPYCRPDEVFLSYINQIILKQFRLIIEGCTDIIRGSSQTFPFPYNIVAILIFGATLVTYLNSVFKYIISPRVWFGIYTNKSSGGTKSATTEHSKGITEPFEDPKDRISGSNLKLLLESFKHSLTKSENPKSPEIVAVSGVEMIDDASSEDSNSVTANQEKVCKDKTACAEKSSNSSQSEKNEFNLFN